MSGANPVSPTWGMSQFATFPTTCQTASVDQVGPEIVFYNLCQFNYTI